jgi:hypothetical protein
MLSIKCETKDSKSENRKTCCDDWTAVSPPQIHFGRAVHSREQDAVSISRAKRLISRCRWSAVTDLDLDYLERRREHAREPRGPPPETEASPDSMDLVKVILLGAPAVGKTSIIQVGYVSRVLLLNLKIIVREPQQKNNLRDLG